MQSIEMQLLDKTNSSWRGFQLQGTEVLHRCLICNETFPQTDQGWIGLKEHGFVEHEQGMHYDWQELNGEAVTVVVIERGDEDIFGESQTQFDLWLMGKDGTMYAIKDAHTGIFGGTAGGFKWKPKSQSNNLKMLTQNVAE